MLAYLVGFIPVGLIITIPLGLLLGMEPKGILGLFLFMVGAVGLGLLSVRFKIVDRSIKRGFALYFRFSVWIVIALGPMILFYKLSQFVLAKLSDVFQIILFVAWGSVLAGALMLITVESWRESLFDALRKFGRFTPFIYSFNVLLIAIVFFSSVTYVLVEHELVRFSGPAERDVSPGALSDFYLWHFLESLPLLKVNETLHWEKPLTYNSPWVGLVLLLFKLTVIVPVLAAFISYWAHLGGKQTRDE